MEPNETRADPQAGDSLSDALNRQLDAQRVNDPMPGINTEQVREPDMVGHPALDVQDDDETPQPDPSPAITPEPQETPDEQQRRFASWEEAERRQAEDEKRLREHQEQQAWLQQRLDRVENDYEQLRQEALRKPEPEPEPLPPPTFNSREHWSNAYRRIDALDPDATDYEERRLDIIGEAQDSANEQLTVAYDTRTQALIARDRQTQQEAFRTETQQLIESRFQETERGRRRERLISTATEAGLDIAEPSQDNRLGGRHYQEFWYAVENGLYPQNVSEAEATKAVVDLIVERHGVTPASPAARINGQETADEIRRAQAMNTPMERQGQGRAAPTPPPDETGPVSMEEVVQRTLQPRRVKA